MRKKGNTEKRVNWKIEFIVSFCFRKKEELPFPFFYFPTFQLSFFPFWIPAGVFSKEFCFLETADFSYIFVLFLSKKEFGRLFPWTRVSTKETITKDKKKMLKKRTHVMEGRRKGSTEPINKG